MTATETLRHAGINDTVSRWLDANADYVLADGATREGVAVTINGLAALGRSGKWKGAVAYWADLVMDTDTDLRWALLQGSVAATHAA
jgi:hypothetical protein